jgi:hypothetical protein
VKIKTEIGASFSSYFPPCPNDCESRALNSIKSHVETALRELSLESFAKFESELYQVRIPRIFFVLESFPNLPSFPSFTCRKFLHL